MKTSAVVRNPDYARQAIVTRYHGPTNYRGARIGASASAGRISVPYDHALTTDDSHAMAACAFADKFGWGGEWVHGVLPNGDHVFTQILEAR